MEYLFYILFTHRITAKDLVPLKKRIRSFKMEWWEAGDLQFYMYVNEHQKWPLQNNYVLHKPSSKHMAKKYDRPY